MKPKVDVLQVFSSTAAIFGLGVISINFNEKVFKTVCPFKAAQFFKRRLNPITTVLIAVRRATVVMTVVKPVRINLKAPYCTSIENFTQCLTTSS